MTEKQREYPIPGANLVQSIMRRDGCHVSTVIVLKPENAESGAVAVMPVKAPTRLALPF